MANITIRLKFLGFSLSIALLAVVLVTLVWLLRQNAFAVSRAEMAARESLMLAAELRLSSEELTRLARTYVVTNDKAYEKAYWQVLDIRNGKTARPDGRQASLRSLMERAGFVPAEFAKMKEAEDNSNALVATETAAFQAMIGRFMPRADELSVNPADYIRSAPPDQAMAIRIVHDAKYHADKALIMGPINEVEALVKERTESAVDAELARGKRLIELSGLIGVMIVALLLASHLVAQRPVLTALENVRAQLQSLARGTLSLADRLQVARDDEIGGVAMAFNSLMERLLVLVRQIQETGGRISSATTQIAASSRVLETTLNDHVSSTQQVVASAGEISATTRSLAETMAQVVTLSDEAAGAASEGRIGLARVQNAMQQMAQATEALRQKLSGINAKVSNISTIVTTITMVADQTNLLSLNASIEAAKVGEEGHGFAVVAREIRRLADQTAVATLDIEQTVKEVQSSVSSGVLGIENFAEEVRSAAGEAQEITTQITRIIDQAQGLGPRFAYVNEGMESQSIGASQISDGMVYLSDAVRSAAQSQAETVRAIEDLVAAAAGLRQEVSQFNLNST